MLQDQSPEALSSRRAAARAYHLANIVVFACIGPFTSGCSDGAREYEVELKPQIPDRESGRSLRWSPKGEKLPLMRDEGGLSTYLRLGHEGTPPLLLRLERGEKQHYYNRLLLDRDRDGTFSPDETLEVVPQEIRGKVWSTFEAVVDVPATASGSGEQVTNPYPLTLWFIDDPNVVEEELILRFSRSGWMEGRVNIGGVEAVVVLIENEMDGVFDHRDSWALASRDSLSNLFEQPHARSVDTPVWLRDDAHEIVELDPSGRRVVLRSYDPRMTSSDEANIEDHLAEDRGAARSGRSVEFLDDFAKAEMLAREANKHLFVDFWADWCGPCHVMDKWVFTADSVVEAAGSYVSVKVDGDENPELEQRFGIVVYPTMLVLDADGRVIRQAVGYQSVREMVGFLRGS